MIKAIIFDLDDTLFDTSGQLKLKAIKVASVALKENNFPEESLEKLYKRLISLFNKIGSKKEIFDTLCSEYGLSAEDANKFTLVALNAYLLSDVPDSIFPFDDTLKTLKDLDRGYKLFLVTKGDKEVQTKKVRLLGIEDFFYGIYFVKEEKKDMFKKIMRSNKFLEREVLVVGDSLYSEIREGNELNLLTVQFLHGRRKRFLPRERLDMPDYKVKKLMELPRLIKEIDLYST